LISCLIRFRYSCSIELKASSYEYKTLTRPPKRPCQGKRGDYFRVIYYYLKVLFNNHFQVVNT
jgi:hypothetical protein